MYIETSFLSNSDYETVRLDRVAFSELKSPLTQKLHSKTIEKLFSLVEVILKFTFIYRKLFRFTRKILLNMIIENRCPLILESHFSLDVKVQKRSFSIEHVFISITRDIYSDYFPLI